MKPEIILASRSPRRRELLAMLGMDFRVMEASCDETLDKQLPPADFVQELAKRKAASVANQLDVAKDFIVIGADTIVWDQNRILGKPRDAADARDTILALSGHAHSVYTGIALIGKIGEVQKSVSDSVKTEVVFDKITPGDADWYLSTGEAMDKAGSYAIQGKAGIFVKELHGDYYNVVGLPLARMRTLLLDGFGLSVGDFAAKR